MTDPFDRSKRLVYRNGYHQAEKDLALTWEDIRKIVVISEDVFEEGNNLFEEEYYEEVLKRYFGGKEMRKLEDMCVVCNDHDKPSCGYEVRKLQRKCSYNDFIERGYDLAEQDIIALIESIIEGIIGDAQPKPILRAELQELITKIKERTK